MEVEKRLLPILREGVDVVKMVFYRRLRTQLAARYPGTEPSHLGRLAGAVINEVFGTPNDQEPFAGFAREHHRRIQEILADLAVDFEEFRIPLTDALRISFLCDSQETGQGDSSVLKRAHDLGILMLEREIPMPAKFLSLVRRLGEADALIVAPVASRAGEAAEPLRPH